MNYDRNPPAFECPHPHCRGGYRDRQRPLTRGQIDSMRNAGVADGSSSLSYCTYCDCVYEAGVDGSVMWGWLVGDQWRPLKRRMMASSFMMRV